MNIPRNHHYIPQFWLKRFSHDGASKLVWSYDWTTDKTAERSVEKLMSEHDLYTQMMPTGPDVSLETGALGRVDTKGARLFREIDAGDRSSTTREELADFFAVTALRHPVTVNRYPTAVASLLINIQEALEASTDLQQFRAEMQNRGVPNFTIELNEFADLKSATPQARDVTFGSLFDAAMSSGGTPDLPFADVINDSTGRGVLKDRLLGMKWVLRKAAKPDLVIGDTGIVFERGESDLGWKIVMGPDLTMWITKAAQTAPNNIECGALEPWEVQSLNTETAARSRSLLVGRNKDAVSRAAKHVKR